MPPERMEASLETVTAVVALIPYDYGTVNVLLLGKHRMEMSHPLLAFLSE